MEQVTQPAIAFLFIGGAHQVYHLAPVAAELSRRNARVECLYPDDATGAALAEVRETLGAETMRLVRVETPRWAAGLSRLLRRQSVTKLPLLLGLLPRLAGAAAVVTPERTSALLRRFGLRRPLLIHFRHGAGDRAPKSEARLKAFDLVVVPGDKDLRRAVEVQHLPRERLYESGYIKLDYLARAGTGATPLFDNDRPTVLYNPHFDAALSSWPLAEAIVAAFAAQDRYNLVVAPHLRLSQDMSPAERARWQALAVPGRILVDLGSPRLIDMTYVRTADIYLGDVSSQFYEFIGTPRPAVFVNAHAVDWRGDPRYANWHLGEVVADPGDVIAAVERARAAHPALVAAQRAAVVEAFGDYDGASARGAAIVAAALGLAPVAEPMLT